MWGRGARILEGGVPFALILGGWWLVAESGRVDQRFLPTPLSVLRAAGGGIWSEGWGAAIAVSALRVAVAFLFAAAVAIPLGLLMGTSRSIDRGLHPMHSVIRYVPVAALVPIAVLWLGIGDVQKVFLIWVGTYFQLVLMIAATVESVPREYVETYSLIEPRRLSLLRHVVVPASAPHVFDHLRIAAAWAWSYLLVAEIVAAEDGIGFAIIQAQRFLQTDRVFAAILLIAVLGGLTDLAFLLARPRLFPWFEWGNGKERQH